MRPFRRKKAFTLVELVMTIVLVGIISVPLSLFVVRIGNSVFQSHDHSLGMNLARLEMEKVYNTAYASLTAGTTNFSNYQGYSYNAARTVAYVFGADATAESLKLVTVTVTRPTDSQIVGKLMTQIAKNVAYGL